MRGPLRRRAAPCRGGGTTPSAAHAALLLQIDGRRRRASLAKTRSAAARFGSGARALLDARQSLRRRRACLRRPRRSQSARETKSGTSCARSLCKRIARLFGGDLLRALVGLSVLARMAGQPRHRQPHQRGPAAGAHAVDRILDAAPRRSADRRHRRRAPAGRESSPDCRRCCRPAFAAREGTEIP